MEVPKLHVSTHPHIFDRESISSIMYGVVIALIPLGLAGIYFFGVRALYVILTTVITAVLTETIIQKFFHRRAVTSLDGSAIVTGLLLAYILPPTIPYWTAAVGAVISILLGKQIFGGLGYNIFNPALVGRAILLSSWPAFMTSWQIPLKKGVDALTSATPLAMAKAGEKIPTLMDMFIGKRAGCIGETSALLIIVCGLYLLYKNYISYHIPFTYLATVVFLTVILGKFNLVKTNDPLFYLMGGGLLLGAFFMATDMVTIPMTDKGKIIFGVGCGIITVLVRFFGGFPEGVCYSILFMNCLTPLIDRYTRPQKFGRVKELVKG